MMKAKTAVSLAVTCLALACSASFAAAQYASQPATGYGAGSTYHEESQVYYDPNSGTYYTVRNYSPVAHAPIYQQDPSYSPQKQMAGYRNPGYAVQPAAGQRQGNRTARVGATSGSHARNRLPVPQNYAAGYQNPAQGGPAAYGTQQANGSPISVTRETRKRPAVRRATPNRAPQPFPAHAAAAASWSRSNQQAVRPMYQPNSYAATASYGGYPYQGANCAPGRV